MPFYVFDVLCMLSYYCFIGNRDCIDVINLISLYFYIRFNKCKNKEDVLQDSQHPKKHEERKGSAAPSIHAGGDNWNESSK